MCIKTAKKEGPAVEYYANGKVKEKGNYILNKRTGSWEYFSEDGTIKEKRGFDDRGEKQGQWIVYYPGGKQQQLTTYEKGEKTGAAAKYYENGSCEYKGTYTNNKKTGKWVYYYANGITAKEEEYDKDSKREGKWTKYYSGGNIDQVVTYRANSKDGIEEKYTAAGVLQIRNNWKEDELDGKMCVLLYERATQGRKNLLRRLFKRAG
ncbi:MAG: hypothetical protein LUH15_07360 [Tannerellaceae bacterium]|nr:hypothetical protein [Tannerellaceae bacterium]